MTATLGLVQMRKGHQERGQGLYEEAIGLARSSIEKVRIGQKLNLELARCAMAENPKKAHGS